MGKVFNNVDKTLLENLSKYILSRLKTSNLGYKPDIVGRSRRLLGSISFSVSDSGGDDGNYHHWDDNDFIPYIIILLVLKYGSAL